jgi:predicted DNA binding CopG/RHH family protein
MPSYKLSEEEQEILDAFDAGKIKPIPNAKEEIEKHKKYAAEALKKDKVINIRIANQDLSEIQKMAILEGISYQKFIISVLHKFADGQYVEKKVYDQGSSQF